MLLGFNSERSDAFDKRPQLDIGRFVIGEVAKDIVIRHMEYIRSTPNCRLSTRLSYSPVNDVELRCDGGNIHYPRLAAIIIISNERVPRGQTEPNREVSPSLLSFVFVT